MSQHPGDIPVVVIQQARPAAHVAKQKADIQSPWVFAAWMGIAALVAVLAGLVLGALAGAEIGIGSGRWTQAVEAHGRLQLFGFVATFVVALGLEFLPRLNQRPLLPRFVRAGVPGLIAAGSLVGAGAQFWHEEAAWLAIPSGLMLTAGAAAFALVAWRIPHPRALRIDPQPLFVRLAALWLVAAAAHSAWALANATDGVVPAVDSRIAAEMFLRGFIVLTITGIGLRAFVGHLNLRPLTPRQQVLLIGMVNVSLVAWLAGEGFGPLAGRAWLVRAADVGYGLTLLLLVHWFQLLPRVAGGPKPPRYEWFIPVAWLGLVAYAVMLAGAALFFGNERLNLYQDGALRHTLVLGFMVPLMVAMTHIVLARFATGRVQWEPALNMAFVLVMVAWPMRVIPALGEGRPSALERASLGLSGVVLMCGLGLVAAVALRAAWVVRRR
ncbi:MAG: hypothetical protein AB7T37_08710 [Dehalococcoidia bacterium]